MSTPRLLNRIGALSPLRRCLVGGVVAGSLAIAIPGVAGASTGA